MKHDTTTTPSSTTSTRSQSQFVRRSLDRQRTLDRKLAQRRKARTHSWEGLLA